ncbi:MAG: response regulator transcription factor [Maritimibacter sp.]
MASPNIILVEDDTLLRETLEECFTQSGIPVVAAASALQFYRLLASAPCDIVVLDIGLPDEDGLSILRFLRQEKPDIGVIMMTARSTVDDRISGLKSGADLYLTKPVEYEELELAIQNLARRLGAFQSGEAAAAQPVNGWLFQRQALRLVAPNDKPIMLTHQECRLLSVFVQSGETTIPRNDLLKVLGYPPTESGDRSLNAVLVRLRAKAKESTGLALPIQTIRGQGYLARNLTGE